VAQAVLLAVLAHWLTQAAAVAGVLLAVVAQQVVQLSLVQP
jgi:hypothetical protein